MTNLNQKYLADAEAKVRGMANRSVSATGRIARPGQRMLRADGWLQRQMQLTGNVESGRFFPADGNAGAAQGGFSQPIVLQISNSSSASTSVNLWGASVYTDQSAGLSFSWLAGNLVQGTVTISVVSQVGTTGFNTYYSALQQLQVMTIAKTALNVIAGPNSQISQTWGLNTFATNANFAGQQFVNYVNPQQYQSGVIENFSQYDLDATTYVSIPVLGSAVFQMFFFPLVNLNPSRALLGQPQAKMFAPPPGNLAPQPVVVQS